LHLAIQWLTSLANSSHCIHGWNCDIFALYIYCRLRFSRSNEYTVTVLYIPQLKKDMATYIARRRVVVCTNENMCVRYDTAGITSICLNY
jgi:hypothetical protein